jgi:hypothetical protein
MFSSKTVIQTHTDLGTMFLVKIHNGSNTYSNKLEKALCLDNLTDKEVNSLFDEAKKNEAKYSNKQLTIDTYEYLE